MYPQTWYQEAGSDVEVQSQGEHVVDAVYSRNLEQLKYRALAFVLPLVNDGVITSQRHGTACSLVGLR